MSPNFLTQPSSISPEKRVLLEMLKRDILRRDLLSTPDQRPLWADSARPEQLTPAGQWPVWLIQAGRGWGKALYWGMEIPTPSGFKTMQDLKAGDTVFDERGQPCTVEYATGIMFGRTCYEVVFDDGTALTVDAEHEWETWDKSARKALGRRVRNPNPAYVSRAARYAAPASKVVTTEQIRATLMHGLERNHSIATCGPVAYPEQSLPIAPYTLGAWLGDGDSAGAVLTGIDPEILNRIEQDGYAVKPYSSNGKTPRYALGKGKPQRDPATGRMQANNSLNSALAALGVRHNKHIPRSYLQASIEQRTELLKGLMDTDGSIEANGRCELVTVRPNLAPEVLELVRSLGIKATLTEDRAQTGGKDCGPRFRIKFTPNLPVFALPRKLNRQRVIGQQAFRTTHRYIVDVRPVESVPVRCIRVSSESHLFLCSRSFIPTHNTRAGAEWVLEQVREGQARRIALIGATAADVRDVMVEGESGIMACARAGERPVYEPSKRRLTWPNGAIATTYSADEPERLRGPQHDRGWCFIAGTQVLTASGEMPIESVSAGDYVQTRSGFCRVLSASVRRAAVGRVEFDTGSILIGTADHPVYTLDGWTALADLSKGAPVCAIGASNGTAKSGTSTELDADPTTNGRTSQNGPYAYTAPYGNLSMDPGQVVLTFTTLTATVSTTLSATLSSWLTLPTAKNILRKIRPFQWTGQVVRFSANYVRIVADQLNAKRKPPQSVSSADQNGLSKNERRSVHVISAGSILPAAAEIIAASVVSTWQPQEHQNVYCLKVQGAPEYFANGILVHNCDEPASWRRPEAWTMYQFGLRLGSDPRSVVTGTPKPVKLIREILALPGIVVTRGRTLDNAANLAPQFLEKIVAKYQGTRLGRQELDGELLEDTPGALWSWQMFSGENFRPLVVPPMRRIVVAIDPAASSGEDSDETGIIAAGLGLDGRGYVLADATLKAGPTEWAQAAVGLYRSLNADRIIAERNNGGDMVAAVLRSVAPGVPIRTVWASQGKATRAEPVAALYEQGNVSHVGLFSELENQMTTWMPGEGKSPDRVDALVWALTELMLQPESLTPTTVTVRRRSVVT